MLDNALQGREAANFEFPLYTKGQRRVEVLLNARRTQGFSTEMFTRMGVDLSACRIIVTKSSQHFFASFSRIAARTIYVDAPGTLTSDLTTLPYRKARRAVIEGY